MLTTNTSFVLDFMDIIRLFAPNVNVLDSAEECNISVVCADDLCDIVDYSKHDNVKITITYANYINSADLCVKELSEVKSKSEVKRLAKVMLYDLLAQKTGVSLPYGSLTGIRPTKLYHEREASDGDAYDYFRNFMRVNTETTDFIREICDNQAGIYSLDENEADFFVNIPICVSRCSYCSFISAELGRIKHWVAPYVAQLIREIETCKQIVKDSGYKIRSIYVGGGTPTSLSECDFDAVISALVGIKCDEFTVEAGRPDTITRAKLDSMARCGVTRISINPQTFNDETLASVGRNHTSSMIYEVYNMAREYEFDINMDLIAMLPNESLEDFKHSVDEAIKLAPDNITVHTLAIKKGSALKLASYDNYGVDLPACMVDYSRKAIEGAGYSPYYMYKQKYMSGNLDNTGYMKDGKACIYNVDIMEETHSIIAAGAGGISKRVFHSEGRIERLANPKGIDVYMEREEKITNDKKNFFK